MISGLTAAKPFQICCHFPSPALAALHAQPIIRYFAVPPFFFFFGMAVCVIFCSALWLSFQRRPCHSYVHLRRWQGPVGPPWCVPVLPMGAPGCCSGSVVWCSCSCLPACRAPYRAVFRGLCGWCVCVAVLSLAVRMVRAAGLVPWCRDDPSGVAGWARRNTSVPAGRGRHGPVWRACGPLRALGGVSEGRNTGQCCSPPLDS